MAETPLIEKTDAEIAGAGATPDPTPEPAPGRPKRKRAPKATAPKRERTPRQPGVPRATTRRPALAPRVAQAHVMIGLGVSFAPIPNAQATGMAMVTNAEQIGEAWEQLAKENPRVREALEKLLTAGAVGALMMAYMPVVLAGMGKGDIAGALGGLAANLAPDIDEPTPPAPGQSQETPGATVLNFGSQTPKPGPVAH